MEPSTARVESMCVERVHRGQHCVCVEPMCMEHVRVAGNTHST